MEPQHQIQDKSLHATLKQYAPVEASSFSQLQWRRRRGPENPIPVAHLSPAQICVDNSSWLRRSLFYQLIVGTRHDITVATIETHFSQPEFDRIYCLLPGNIQQALIGAFFPFGGIQRCTPVFMSDAILPD